MAPHRCGICGGSEGRGWNAREMMFGLRDPFTYFECDGCGCLQLVDPPADLGRYYPPSYYSLEPVASSNGGPAGWLRRERNRFAFTGTGAIGGLLQRLAPYPIESVKDWVAAAGTGSATRILDVGCGTGALVADLAAAGFPAPVGIDPFVSSDIRYDSGARVLKRNISEMDGEFDLVIFNHSLEHLPDQREALEAARRVLARGGLCVARTPTVSSFAWEHYRTDWVQLDAPRHLFLHSVRSIRHIAAAAGLDLVDVRYDSFELQFVGSELYRQDIAYVEGSRRFTPGQLRSFRRRARELNEEGRGDQASFFLRHSA